MIARRERRCCVLMRALARSVGGIGLANLALCHVEHLYGAKGHCLRYGPFRVIVSLMYVHAAWHSHCVLLSEQCIACRVQDFGKRLQNLALCRGWTPIGGGEVDGSEVSRMSLVNQSASVPPEARASLFNHSSAYWRGTESGP